VAKIKNILVVFIPAALTVLISCSPKLSNNLLTFFFDGVPSIDSMKTESPSQIKNREYIQDTLLAVQVSGGSDYTIHYPYKEKDCFSCHDEKSKSELIMPQPGLCYTCHDDYSKNSKYVHGPVAAGYCTSCHNPHMSKEKKLLIRTGQQLCLDCHEAKSVFKSETHKHIADSECTLCHNPHRGGDRFILN
jgi:predicted CXXCH cytochrome family protein